MKHITLVGKFHSHITISSQFLDKAHDILLKNKVQHKMTTIELTDFSENKQTDVMITQHFHTRKWKCYENIKKYLDKTCQLLEENGIPVIRLKIEHEDVNYNPDDCCYIETHIKILIPISDRENILNNIKNNPLLNGFVPSRNPNEIKGQYCHQFLNKRWYSGTLNNLNNDIFIAQKELQMISIIKEIKTESAIYDSNNQLDKWWV